MEEDHSVPLTAQALAILEEMRNGSQGDLIFPSEGDEPFSDMAMLAVLDRLAYGHVTVHGFRATFATWAEECTDHDRISGLPSRCATASRKVASLAPSGSTIGSSKRRDQDKTQLRNRTGTQSRD